MSEGNFIDFINLLWLTVLQICFGIRKRERLRSCENAVLEFFNMKCVHVHFVIFSYSEVWQQHCLVWILRKINHPKKVSFFLYYMRCFRASRRNGKIYSNAKPQALPTLRFRIKFAFFFFVKFSIILLQMRQNVENLFIIVYLICNIKKETHQSEIIRVPD